MLDKLLQKHINAFERDCNKNGWSAEIVTRARELLLCFYDDIQNQYVSKERIRKELENRIRHTERIGGTGFSEVRGGAQLALQALLNSNLLKEEDEE